MPRKKSTPPTSAPATDNSGFDVPPPASAGSAEFSANVPAGPPPDEATLEPGTSPEESQPATDAAKPSPVNATTIVKVPKHSFLRLQRMQTEKAKQEQLRQLARRHPVVRDLLAELDHLRTIVEGRN